jgi:hypothetical protein
MSRALRSQRMYHASPWRPPLRLHAAIVKRTVTVIRSRRYRQNVSVPIGIRARRLITLRHTTERSFGLAKTDLRHRNRYRVFVNDCH